MKNTALLFTAILCTLAAGAQYSHLPQGKSKRTPAMSMPVSKPGVALYHAAARTTTTAFVAEDFSSGSATSLPTGWTTGAITTGSWKWTDHASSSTYTMGAMASSSAANGWMIFDSDSIGTACSCAPAGWLQSPSYNCSAHAHVRLNFEDYFRKLQDTCYVWVSTSPTFSTYTSYPVTANNSLSDDVYGPNPAYVHINISASAGSQAAVYIRFVTISAFTGGSYSWMIDDLSLTDVDSVDAGVSSPAVVYAVGSSAYTFGAMPLKMAPPVSLQSFVSNYGFTPEPSLAVNGQIFQGVTSAYSSSISMNLPVFAIDSLADFSTGSPATYTPNAQALYTGVITANAAADALSGNNTDTTLFAITDTVWSMNGPVAVPNSAFFVFEPGSTAYAYSPATIFGVPVGQSDTLTSVSVAFGPETKSGQTLGVQLYHMSGGAWVYDGTTEFRPLTTAEISTPSVFNYATFATDRVASGGPVILHGGQFYAAVVKGLHNTDTVTVLQGDNTADIALMGPVSIADTSTNDGSATHTFAGSIVNGVTPYITLNFGPADYTGVHQVSTAAVSAPYPNPANTLVTIPFVSQATGKATVTLNDITGKTIESQTINATAGKITTIVIHTASLPDGIYIYNVSTDAGQRIGKVVVAH